MPPDTTTTYDLSPYADASPERTAEIAEAVSAAVRALNHTTLSGYRWPVDLYTVLGHLNAAAAGVPQALRQSSEWLTDQAAAGRVRHDHGVEATAAAADVAAHLVRAQQAAHDLQEALAAAHTAAAPLAAVPTHDDLQEDR